MGLISRVSSRTYRTDTMGHGILKSAAWALAYMSLAQAELFNMKVQRKINLQKHFTTKIKQTMDQLMTYEGSLHHYSPYAPRRESVSASFPSKKVIKYTPEENAKKIWIDYQIWRIQRPA